MSFLNFSDYKAYDHLVVHCKKDSYDVYIGRPSEWGNPFKIAVASRKDIARIHCLEEYWTHIHAQPDLMRKAVEELQGKILGCWCSPRFCHGHILAKIANREVVEKI